MRKRYHRNNILRLSRQEQLFFDIVIGFIMTILRIVRFIFKAIIEIVSAGYNLFKNAFILYNRGYDITELLDKFHNLTPRQFEIFMAELFRCQGYDTQVTQASHDYGRDIILKKKVNGYVETTYVECKYYAPHNVVGRDICFKLLGSMRMFNADKGIICSTGKFHKNSHEVANEVEELQLMGEEEIMVMLYKLKADQVQRIMFRVNNAS